METIVGLNRGGLAGCSFHSETVRASSVGRKCHVLLGRKEFFHSVAALRNFRLSTEFEDEGHIQFYLNVQCSKKENCSKRSKDCSASKGLRGRDKSLASCKANKNEKTRKMKESTSSSSSSSSESCEEEVKMESRRRRGKIDMEQFKKEWEELSRSPLMNSIPRFTEDFSIEPPLADSITHLEHSFHLSPYTPTSTSQVTTAEPSNCAGSLISASIVSPSFPTRADLEAVEEIDRNSNVPALHQPTTAARVEVCVGGKCKKAGALEVLAAFQAASHAAVTATPCKCMKNCRAVVSVRIQQDDDTNPKTITGVKVDDVNSLLSQHLGVGNPPSGLPSFGSSPPKIIKRDSSDMVM